MVLKIKEELLFYLKYNIKDTLYLSTDLNMKQYIMK